MWRSGGRHAVPDARGGISGSGRGGGNEEGVQASVVGSERADAIDDCASTRRRWDGAPSSASNAAGGEGAVFGIAAAAVNEWSTALRTMAPIGSVT